MKVQFANTKAEIEKIIDLRYEILRKPWDQPKDTATDGLEKITHNAFILNDVGKIIACGRLQENENKIGQIRFMAVDNGEQGKGLGKLILKGLEEKAKELKLNTIELQARENALEFYKNNNYEVKEKSFLLWGIIQHYLMEKKLQ